MKVANSPNYLKKDHFKIEVLHFLSKCSLIVENFHFKLNETGKRISVHRIIAIHCLALSFSNDSYLKS